GDRAPIPAPRLLSPPRRNNFPLDRDPVLRGLCGGIEMDEPDPVVEHCDRHGSLISTRPLPLRRTGGRTRNPIRWLWLSWRYGWSHPDEDLLGVIDAAGDALRAQMASARAVLTGDALQKAIEIEKELEEELCQDVPGL